MTHVDDEQGFRRRAPSAPQIFAYVAQHMLLRRMKLQFEYGLLVDDIGARSVAKFVCTGCPLCQRAVVWITAVAAADASWHISHSIGLRS